MSQLIANNSVRFQMLFSLWSRRLYFRIWLAVVGGVVIVTLTANWGVRLAVEAARERVPTKPREVIVLDQQQRQVGSGTAVRVPGRGVQFAVALNEGSELTLQIAPGPPSAAIASAKWWRTPLGLGWTMTLVGLLVALGVYPIVRRLTKRLEALQRGVQRWGEGELSWRFQVNGQDEVADLAVRINSAAARIEELVNLHKSLLFNASHELRSPLARIRMSVELMGERPSSAFRLEISRSIGELDRLIDEILLSSRLDSNESDIGTVETLDLLALLAEECTRHGVQPEVCEGTDANDLGVRGVSRLLRLAIGNLLENAQRYSKDEATVQVSSVGGFTFIRVCDRGPGIPLDLRDRVFNPFFRLPGASESEGGVGLGLALVRSIARRHSGTAHCEEHAGGGSCFVLTLPKVAPAP